MFKLFYSLLFSILLSSVSFAESQKSNVCIYTTAKGRVEQVNSLEDVPDCYKKTAKCFIDNQRMAKPDEIRLEGTVRSEEIVSTVGKIHIRWPRKIETLFGRTPVRAMADAANTVGRVLKNPAFPTRLQNLNIEWNVVFLDDNMAEKQIPTYLVTNCHPGWMTPPANIYIVGQRVAGGCGGRVSSTSVADADLTEVLLHEMGHAVEYYLLGTMQNSDRKRAEGFATWFANFAAESSTILNPAEVKKKYFLAGKYAVLKDPETFQFAGTFEDYSRASLVFFTIVSARSLRDLMEVYQYVASKQVEFDQAVSAVLHWDTKRLNKEILTFIQKSN